MIRPPLRLLPAACLALLAVASAPVEPPKPREFSFFHENVLGTTLEVRVHATSEAEADRAEARVLAEIDRLAGIFSRHVPASEFSRGMKDGRDGRISPELYAVLAASDRWSRVTQGAFDPRVEPLARLWKAAAAEGRIPTDVEIVAALDRISAPAWRLDPGAGTAARTSEVPLSLDAIAKGTIVDKACAAALGPEVSGALVAIGGDMRAAGTLARRVGIARPRGDSETAEPLATIELRNEALATSGDHMGGFVVQGKRYSHIFDPKTGRPAERTIEASVVAPNAETADALATAFTILPVETSLAIADATPGAACLLVAADGAVHKSRGWSGLERPRARLVGFAPLSPVAGPADAEPWPAGFELAVSFEINKIDQDARRYRRPYVAVWITDKDGFPVRTLVLWVQRTGTRWLPDLTRWYRDDQVRKLADDLDMLKTVSRPTCAAGKYDVVWDGKDDHGKPVGRGTYTLNVEAAREHGTHQIIREEIVLGDRPTSKELKGNVEIKSAAFAYGKRSPAR